MDPRRVARDEDIGLTQFYTGADKVGGRLKVRITDFVVDEVGGEPAEDPNGPYTCAVVRLSNWETNRFVAEASERLRMSRKKIHFSGTKDKRGITTRIFTFEAPPDAVQGLAEMPGVELDRIYRTSTESQLGDHTHNRFVIVLRDIDATPTDAAERIQRLHQEATRLGGYPNSFGPQRFGAVRATTHLVGARIVRGDFLGACHAYLGDGPLRPDGMPLQSWRSALGRRDYAGMLGLTTPDQSFERAILHRLAEQPDEPGNALRALPKNLQLLFVSAYQSFLFNRIVSRRIETGLRLDTPHPGDLVAPVDDDVPLDEWIPVTDHNRERVAQELQNGRAVLTGPLPGTEAPLATGKPGHIERAILEEEAVTPSNFVVPEHLEWSSKGLRRALLLRPRDWHVATADDEFHPGKSAAIFHFTLPRGAYATSVLREIMKAPALTQYA